MEDAALRFIEKIKSKPLKAFLYTILIILLFMFFVNICFEFYYNMKESTNLKSINFNDTFVSLIDSISSSLAKEITFSVKIWFLLVAALVFLASSKFLKNLERINLFMWGLVKKIGMMSPSISKNHFLVIEENFKKNEGQWLLNYWNEKGSDKTNRIDDGSMIFKCSDDELIDSKRRGRTGSYRDFNELEEGAVYEIIAIVKSEKNTTMRTRLWIHDNTVGHNSSIKSVFSHRNGVTPNYKKFEEIKVKFEVNERKAFRVHLDCFPGEGSILYDSVKIYKL